MTEPDFDAYLKLLSRLLQLTRGQQAEITSELRDHLEQRYAELLSQGHPRDAAIRLALDELGDAAVLAGEFAPSLQARRRRTIMRYSLLSASAVAITFVVGLLFGPAGPEQGPTSAVVQAQDRPDEPEPPSGAAPLTEEELRRQIEEKLARRDVPIEFDQAPLTEVLEFFGDALDLDFLADANFLEHEGVRGDHPVTLKARSGALSVRTALELILEQVNGGGLTFVIRDGVVMLAESHAEVATYEIIVYDCRDLIAGVQVEMGVSGPGGTLGSLGGGFGGPGGGGLGGGGGFFQVGPFTAAALSQIGGGPGSGAPGGTAPGGASAIVVSPLKNATSRAGQALIGVIEQATAPEKWIDTEGEGGTISEYDGLLIIHHSQRVHRKVEELLMKLREVRGKQQPAQPALSPGMPGLPGAGPQPGTTGDPALQRSSGLPGNSSAEPVRPQGASRRPAAGEAATPDQPAKAGF